MEQCYEKMREFIEKNQQQMLGLWEELVNIDSGTGDKAGVDRVVAVLRREMEHAGIACRTVPMERAGDFLIGEWNAGAPGAPVVFLGHTDTVFTAGAAAQRPFYMDEAGYAHGPGCLDMKGGLVAGLYAVKALAAAGFAGRPVKLLYLGDEENQHGNSHGVQVLRAECAGGAAAFNFETSDPDDTLVVGRKGGAIVTVSVTGRSAHSGFAPQEGRSAILEMAHKIVAMEALNDIPRGKLVNVGVIKGGSGENVIPDFCTVNLGIRFPTNAIREEIMADLRAIAAKCTVPDTTATVEVKTVLGCMEPTDKVRALFESVRQTAVRCGYGQIGSKVVSGCSDSYIPIEEGVPTLCGFGCQGTGNHSEGESAQVQSLFDRAFLAAAAVWDLA